VVKHGGTGTDGTLVYVLNGFRDNFPNTPDSSVATCMLSSLGQSYSCPMGETAASSTTCASCKVTAVDHTNVNNVITTPLAPAGSGIVGWEISIDLFSPVPTGCTAGVLVIRVTPGASFTDTNCAGNFDNCCQQNMVSTMAGGYFPSLWTNQITSMQYLDQITGPDTRSAIQGTIAITAGGGSDGSPAGLFQSIFSSTTSVPCVSNCGQEYGIQVDSYNTSTTAVINGQEAVRAHLVWGDGTSVIGTFPSATGGTAAVFALVDGGDAGFPLTGDVAAISGQQIIGEDGGAHTYGLYINGTGSSTGPVAAIYENGVGTQCAALICPSTIRSLDLEDVYQAYIAGWITQGPQNLAQWTTTAPGAGSVFYCSDCQVTTVTANVVSNSTCKGSGGGSLVWVNTSGVFKCVYLP
jgi:hypothetical protein